MSDVKQKLDCVSLRATDNLQEPWTVATKLALLDRIADLEAEVMRLETELASIDARDNE